MAEKSPSATRGELALAGKRVVVTGAARGIGLAIAQAFAAAKAQVFIADIDGDEAHKAARKIGAHWLRVDVSKPQEAKRLAKRAAQRMGGIDVLVNNAAMFLPDTNFADIVPRQWSQVLRTNLDGPFLCTQATLPWLEKSPQASVINISSTQGLRGQPGAGAYGAAKGGLVNLTRIMAIDLAPMGIRVNSVAPGFVNTRMAITAAGKHEHEDASFKRHYIRERRIPLARPAQADDIAGPVLFFASDLSRYVTGQTLAADGGLTATY